MPLAKVQSITVAPYFRILADAPDGCLMMTNLSDFSIAILEAVDPSWSQE